MESTASSRDSSFGGLLLFLFLALCSAASLFSSGELRVNNDPGLGWHLETGRLLAASLEFPRLDPFLAGPERTWAADQWLGSLLLYKVYSLSGFSGLAGLSLSLYFLLFWLALAAALRARVASPFALGFALIISFKLSSVQLVTRPVLFGIVLFAAFLIPLWRRSALRPLYHFPLMLLWVNTHSSFVFGLLLSVLLLLDGRSQILKQLSLIGLLFLVTLLNPYGFGIYDSFFHLGGSEFFLNLHNEWKPISLTSPAGNFFLLGFIMSLLGIYETFKKEKETRKLSSLALFLIFSCGALSSVRLAPFFAIAQLPFLALGFLALRDGLARVSAFRLISRFDRVPEAVFRPPLGLAFLITLLLGFGVFTCVLKKESVVPPRLKAVQSFTEYLRREKAVLAAPYNYGGALILACQQSCKPLIDDRNQLLGEDYVRDYLRAWTAKDYPYFNRELGASHILVPSGEELDNDPALELILKAEELTLYRFLR